MSDDKSWWQKLMASPLGTVLKFVGALFGIIFIRRIVAGKGVATGGPSGLERDIRRTGERDRERVDTVAERIDEAANTGRDVADSVDEAANRVEDGAGRIESILEQVRKQNGRDTPPT